MLKRSQGDSAVAAAAYRAGANLRDERQERTHYYARRQRGVVHTEMILPDGAPSGIDREEMWNAAEARERRKDSQVAREFMVALPAELPQVEQVRLARALAEHLVDRYGVAADVAVHDPAGRTGRDGQPQDARNVHAHVLTTRRCWESGEMTDTINALNPYRGTGAEELEELHQWWRHRQTAAVRRHQQARAERADVIRASPHRPRPPRQRSRSGLADRAAALLDVAAREGRGADPSTPDQPSRPPPAGDRPDRREGRGSRS